MNINDYIERALEFVKTVNTTSLSMRDRRTCSVTLYTNYNTYIIDLECAYCRVNREATVAEACVLAVEYFKLEDNKKVEITEATLSSNINNATKYKLSLN